MYSLIILIILLSFFPRVYRLGVDASFSADEVTTVTSSMQEVTEIPKLQNRTPLQALLVAFGAQVLGLGYSEFAVYLLSVIASVMAVAVIYHLGNLLFDYRVGLLCAFMLAFSAYYIYWSRSARYYALMVLLSSVSFLFLYWALVTNHRRAWLAYALFRTLSLYNHLTALWIFAGEGIFTLAYISLPALGNLWKHRHEIQVWQNKEIWWRVRNIARQLTTSRFFWFLISMTLILLAYAPVWYSLLRDIYLGSSVLRLAGLSTELMAPRDPSTVQPQSVLGGGWFGPFLVFYLLAAWITPLHVLMIVLFAVGIMFCVLHRQWTQLFFVLTIMVTPFILATMIRSYSFVLNGRYLISLLPLYYVMIGRGIIGFGHRIVSWARLDEKRGGYVTMAIAVVFALVYAGLNFTKIPLTFRNTGQNWRVVSYFLAENVSPDQTIVVHGRPQLAKALQYYLPEHKVVEGDQSQSLETLYQEEDGFWLVFQPGTDMYTGLRYWLNDHSAVSLIFTGGWYPDIDRTTDLAPAQNWDLYVAYASRTITSAEQALELHRVWLSEATARNPNDVRLYLTMAEAYQRFDRCDLAISEYTQALMEGYVNNQLASYILDARGRCWQRLGVIERAIADWQQAITYAAWNKKPYELLGYAYIQMGKVDEVRALYLAARQANPNRAWPHVLLGNFYRERGLTEQAIEEYAQAIELEPGDRIAYQQLGKMYAIGEEYDLGILLYQDAKERNPWSGWPHFQLGQFYQRIGKIAKAVAEYQRAVEIQPDFGASVSDMLLDANWNMASVLNLVHVFSEKEELLWWQGDSWVKPYPFDPDVLVGPSTLEVGSHVHLNQLHLHPFSFEDNTFIEFEIPNIPFTHLKVGYGMADEVAGLGNGVQYLVQVRRKGDHSYDPLLDIVVTDNVWEERTVPLAPYWGEDLDFRLVVNARGDYDYDWLQTTFQLVPPPQVVWDLSAHLAEAQFLVDASPLKWQSDGFYSSKGIRLVGQSELPVEGRSLPGQVILHPYSSEVDSTLVFNLPNQPYRVLKTSFGLADEALPNSNGVEYTISISVDGGQSFVDLIQTTVTANTWGSEIVNLPITHDLMLKVRSSARQDIANDWLQINLVLLPLSEGKGMSELKIDDEMIR